MTINNANGHDITSKPIGLTDRQMTFLEKAIRAVPPRQREEFMQRVAKHLCSEPTDETVAAAVNGQMDLLVPHHFLGVK